MLWPAALQVFVTSKDGVQVPMFITHRWAALLLHLLLLWRWWRSLCMHEALRRRQSCIGGGAFGSMFLILRCLLPLLPPVPAGRGCSWMAATQPCCTATVSVASSCCCTAVLCVCRTMCADHAAP